MSMKLPNIDEKMATPISIPNAINSLSALDLGSKSPNPTVLNVVKLKYFRIIILVITAVFSLGVLFIYYGAKAAIY